MVRLMRAETGAGGRILDATALTADYDALVCDVCIVGSGATAQAVARSLDPALSVIVLEAGSAHEPVAELRHALGASIPLRGTHAPDPSGQTSIRLGGSLDLPAVRLRPSDQHGDGIRLAPLHPNDFASRPIGSRGWPLTFDEISPYYTASLRDFGINELQGAGPSSAAVAATVPFWCVSRSHIAVPDHDRFGAATVVVNAPVWKLELDRGSNVSRALIRHPSGGEIRVEATRFVLAAGTYSSTRILLESGRSTGNSFANSSGLLGRGLMDHPQLNLGSLRPSDRCNWEELRRMAPREVALNQALWPKLVTNADDQTTGLAVTVLPTVAGARFDEPPRVLGGLSGAQSLADELRARKPSRTMARSATRAALGSPDLVRLWAAQRKRSANGWSFENGWWGNEPNLGTFDVLGLSEQLPQNDNRVTLGQPRNRLGWGQLQVHWRWSSEDRALAHRASDPIIATLEEQFGQVRRTPQRRHVLKFSSHHGSGTVRMSADPSQGIVDAQCRSHDHGNLFVVGAAVFPSIGFANPTLTSVALGLRLGEHLSTVS